MKKIAITILLCLFFISCGANTTNPGVDNLPDFPAANADNDSWKQWQSYDDNIIDIHWYVDLGGFYFDNSTLIANVIREKTGINIIFETPSISDGSKLSTMISGDKLPDVISIAANTTDRIQLAEEEDYLYSVTELSKKWAPSLDERLEEEVIRYYKSSDGELYGIPQYFYSTDKLEEIIDMDYNITSNGAIVARKDYLDAYHNYMYEQDPNWDPSSVANPEGILTMSLWVKNHFNLDASNPTVCLSPFESQRTNGSVGLRWLMEYFSVPQEDAEGNFVYQYSTPEFEEMMVWLNSLYRNKLLTTGNMTATSSQISNYIQKGLPFIFIGSPQDYGSNFKNWILSNDKGEDAEYVPIIFTNSEGTVPQLSITGNSYMFNMITKNCERPDRVIKLFDFLYSEEGQRLLYYGTQAENAADESGTYYYSIEPGTTIILENGNEYTYQYGEIEYTDKILEAFNKKTASAYGFFSPSVALSGAYQYISSARHGQFYTYTNYVVYNLKSALKPYYYIYRGFEFELDSTKENYLSIINIETDLRLLWNEYYASIICAKNETIARSLIEETLVACERKGLTDYVQYVNDSFQAHKEIYGINYAWPINDPNSDYNNLVIESVYGDVSYRKEIPDSIEKE